ncbi:MAG: LuxR C-terminal-related transcriptional regulator, partial [Actinobacteria bacterium]|nr:LuxR C-terminal-related transcriptional regulator [Actinomycetota bacterium]
VLDAFDGTPLVLGPLDDAAARTTLTDLWGAPPDDQTLARLLAATGGNPRLLVAVAGTEPTTEVAGTATLDELVRSERQRLDEDSCALLDAIGVLAGLDISVLAAAADLPIDAATDAAARLAGAGLTLDASGRMAPVLVSTVRQLVPATEIATLVDRAATTAVRMGHDLTGIAEHIRGSVVASAAAAACLIGAARQVLDDAPHRAQIWLEAAGHGGAAEGDLAAMRALVAFRQDRVRETVTAVDELLRVDPQWHEGPLRREAVEAGAVMLARRGAWERSAALATAAGPDVGNAVALAAIARVALGDAKGVRALGDDAAGPTAPQLRAAAAASLARGLVMTFDDDPTPALSQLLDATRLYELSTPTVRLPMAPHALAALVAYQLWEFDVAWQILEDPPAQDGGESVGEQLLRAWVALRRGDWVRALAAVEQHQTAGYRDPRDALVGYAVQAGVARRRGDLQGMDRAWRDARTLLLRQTPDLLIVQAVGELLITGARLGDRATVRSSLRAIRQLLARAGHPPLWTLPHLWDEMHIAITCDDLKGARTAAQTAASLPTSIGRARVVTAAAACWVDALAETAGTDRIRGAATGLADIGLTWEASRLAGAAAIRMADSAAMRSLLQFARGLTAERTPQLTTTTSDLSPRERDVAAHLLAGLTYREIGGQLYIAPKTVEHHVARIRRKLGVKTRAELLLALRRHVAIV